MELLSSMIESNSHMEVARKCIAAIALHDDPRVAGILEAMTGQSYDEQLRGAAVLWLSHIPEETPFLERLSRDDRNSMELRRKAIRSIGMSEAPSAIRTLESIYDSATDARIKKEAVQAAGIGRDSDEATAFLIRAASGNTDREIKKAAIFWLGQKAGERALKTLGDMATIGSDDTEIQKQAVFAISRRPADEAIPILIKIARTHPNARVRKQAVFWLGQTGDERAIEFFKELLSK
jgi:HEAT repeat protein